MYDFLATATDKDGKRSTQHVIAPSTTAAVAQLEAEGWSDIVLHTDDAGAAAIRMTALESDAVTPEDLVDLRSVTPFGFFVFLLKKLLHASRFTLLASTAFVAWTILQNYPFGILFWIAVAFIATPFLVAFYLSFFSSSRKFDHLMNAWAWGRWETVLALAPQLRGHVPDFELDAREAVALAKIGRFDEGLSRLRNHVDNGDVPRWMYLGRLGEFYECVEQNDTAIQTFREAYEDAPDNPTVQLDYAMSLLKNETDIEEAERLIASAEEKPLSDILQMVLPFLHGLRDLNRGRYAEAKGAFLEAKSRLSPLSAAQPLIRLILDINSAYLAIACAKNGESECVKEHYEPAKKRLEALGSQRLLSRLNKEVALAEWPDSR